MSRLYSLSIATKLALSFLFVNTIFALIGSYIGVITIQNSTNSTVDGFIQTTIDGNGDFITKKMLENDKWGLYKFLKTLSYNDYIEESFILDVDEKVIAHTKPKLYPIKSSIDKSQLKKGVSFPISTGERKLGALYVVKNQKNIDEKGLKLVKSILALFVFMALGSWLLAVFISKRMLHRLQIATKNAEYIAKNEWDRVERVHFKENDEITVLLETICSMSDAIKDSFIKIDDLRDFYHTILSKIDALVLIVDENRELIYDNGHHLKAIITKEIANEAIREKFNEGGAVEIKYDGRFFLFSFADTSRGCLVLVYEVSTIKELEKKYAISKSLSILGEMNAFLSHELKNLLLPLKLLIDAKKLDQKDIAMMKKSIHSMDSFVSNFLNFAKPVEYTDECSTHIESSLESVLFLVGERLSKKEVIVHKNYDEAGFIQMHPKAFEIIILNLLLNAADALDIGGSIWIESGRSDKYAILKVEDNGCGIPKDIMDRIFEPFFTTKSEGTGLGLALVFRLLEDARGEIDINSKVGSTVVMLKIPTQGA